MVCVIRYVGDDDWDFEEESDVDDDTPLGQLRGFDKSHSMSRELVVTFRIGESDKTPSISGEFVRSREKRHRRSAAMVAAVALQSMRSIADEVDQCVLETDEEVSVLDPVAKRRYASDSLTEDEVAHRMLLMKQRYGDSYTGLKGEAAAAVDSRVLQPVPSACVVVTHGCRLGDGIGVDHAGMGFCDHVRHPLIFGAGAGIVAANKDLRAVMPVEKEHHRASSSPFDCVEMDLRDLLNSDVSVSFDVALLGSSCEPCVTFSDANSYYSKTTELKKAMRDSADGWLRMDGLRVLVRRRHIALMREMVVGRGFALGDDACAVVKSEEEYMAAMGYDWTYVEVNPLYVLNDYLAQAPDLPASPADRPRVYTLALKKCSLYDSCELLSKWVCAVRLAVSSSQPIATVRSSLEAVGIETQGFGCIIINNASIYLDGSGPAVRGGFEYGGIKGRSPMAIGNLKSAEARKKAMALTGIPISMRDSVHRMLNTWPLNSGSQAMADAGGPIGAFVVARAFDEYVRPVISGAVDQIVQMGPSMEAGKQINVPIN